MPDTAIQLNKIIPAGNNPRIVVFGDTRQGFFQEHVMKKIDQILRVDIMYLLAELDKTRWIPVEERLPTLEDGDEKLHNDGTVDVLAMTCGILHVANFFPKMQVWNGETPDKWQIITLPEGDKQ